ncbi:hypothetical protein HYFRA_00010228 [Hymenoscyphus fraxineus]|uniref:Uncharacterized protein n=1 Tax=Hymenoscyphus fraxineus TaxID=746836 RepID=A0A9N9KV65_9HELO|nr:hypothetical protein HYFRA_00010228 [Hymenoscyphus fraxineus]
MDPNYKFPSSPGTPLFQVSPERANRQQENESPSASVYRESQMHSRESSVHEKVAAFNTLAFQGKQLERKANDAALKRAMLGREEAESEMRRYKEDVRALRRQVEEGKLDKIKVSERLATVMEHYHRAKETNEHTRATYEKELRKSRKDALKAQSVNIKLQEELKAARNSLRMVESALEREKDRSVQREQEAFAARYQLVGVQEEVTHLQEQIKVVEQERDALRTIAQNEEVARIAAEGRMPLPKAPEDDEFASPKKTRKSLDPVTVFSSAVSEQELDEMRMKWEEEQWRANRAHDRIEFLELECRMSWCQSIAKPSEDKSSPAKPSSNDLKSPRTRPNTVYVPEEGVFRRRSPSPSPELLSTSEAKTTPVSDHPELQESMPVLEPPTPEHSQHMHYSRTPSCEPPATAMISEGNPRTSLLSLFDAPYTPSVLEFSIPTISDQNHNIRIVEEEKEQAIEEVIEKKAEETNEQATPEAMEETVYETAEETLEETIVKEAAGEDADEETTNTTVIKTFHTISTTTRIPLAGTPDLTPLPVNPAHQDLTPTMSREEALAQIRERRGRAKSLAQNILTPKKKMVEGIERRDISAPAVRSVPRSRSQARPLTT